MFAAIYTFVWDLLKLLGVVAITDYHARTANILFSLSIAIVLGILIKHKYWIIAFLFALLNRISHIILGVLFKSAYSMDGFPILAILIVGMISALVSLFYFYNLFKIQDFSFEKYLRFRK